MKKSFLITLIVLLSGCGTQITWNKPGLTNESFSKDNLECRVMAEKNSSGNPSLRNEYYKSCMMSRGYTIETSKYGFM